MAPKRKAKLTAKQEKFCQEYLVDLNATQAAIRARYSKKTAQRIGSENLLKPVIQTEIQKLQFARSQRTEITADMVLKELALIGFADMADFIRIDEDGLIQANRLDSLEKNKSRIIKKVKEKRTVKTTLDGAQVLESFYEFELYDKLKSLEMIGKHLGMFNDKQDDGTESPEDKALKMRNAVLEMRTVTNATA